MQDELIATQFEIDVFEVGERVTTIRVPAATASIALHKAPRFVPDDRPHFFAAPRPASNGK